MGLLTAKAIEHIKPVHKSKLHSDGESLYLLVKATGKKIWQYSPSFCGKKIHLYYGSYPEVSLAEARNWRDQQRALIRQGIDPRARKKETLAANKKLRTTFRVLAEDWFRQKQTPLTIKHQNTVTGRLNKYLYPPFGDLPICEIRPQQLLKVLRTIEDSGHIETAHRVLQICSQIFRFAVANGELEQDPTLSLSGALKPVSESHHAAISTPHELGNLLRDINSYNGTPIVRTALKLLPMVFTRPGELCQAEWAEINFHKRQWEIPASKMKMREPHIVPLSTQALDSLNDLRQITGGYRFCFSAPNGQDKGLSEATLRKALMSLGYFGNRAATYLTKDKIKGMHSPHGFRATARTLLDEELKQRTELIEHQLAHGVKDTNGRAYNRTTHLEARANMMQLWSDYLYSIAK